MRLCELFDSEFLNEGGGEMVKHLRALVLDYLTPLATHSIEYVDMEDIKEVLALDNSGLSIDRNLVMQVLDPDLCRMVKKIDGDKVYIQFPVGDIADKQKEDKEKDRQAVKKMAGNTAMKAVKS